MKSVMISGAVIGAFSLIISSGAIAGGGNSVSASGATDSGQPATLGPADTGQPDQSCEETPTTPGHAASAPGSAFNSDADGTGGKAGTVYAGEQPQNSRNTASVSQYDVACVKQP
jgi:hypothetical protein